MMFEPLMMFSKGFRSWIKGAVEDGDGSAGNKDLNFGWDKYLSLWGFRFFGYYEMETIFYGADFPTWQVLSPLLVAMGIQVNLFIKTLMSLRK